jgi:hypothetical protein
MKRKFALGCMILCLAALMGAPMAHAQENGALLDALVKKGVLSDQEAEDIRASEEKDYASTAASKITLSSSIKSITFYGDLRIRYELRDGTVDKGDLSGAGAGASTVFTHNDSQDRSRWRYRLRFGVKGELYDNFFYGIRLATNPNYDRSGNVTFGDGDSAGPFGKDKSLLSVDQVYLGWKPTDFLTLTGGKMPNPFYTTSMVWDDNLNPEGAAEQFNKTFDDVEVFATAGQFIYGDSADNGAFPGAVPAGSGNFDDIFLFEEQVGFKYKFDDNTAFKFAASMMTYSGSINGAATSVSGLYSGSPIVLNNNGGNSPSLFNGPFVGAGSAFGTNVTGINSLAVLETPMEFDFKAGKVPMRVFGDFAYNFEADTRADQARAAITGAEASNFAGSKSSGNTGITLNNTNPTTTGMTAGDVANNKLIFGSNGVQGLLNSGQGFLDQAAYQVGVEAGQLKKKGDWDGKLLWQSTGYYAVDPNLIDSDIFNAATNMEGVVVSVSHNWTDGLSSTIRYAYGNPVNDKLATPNVNQDLQIGTIHAYNLFQADLVWKF